MNTSKSHLLRAKKSVQNYLLNNVVSQNTPKKKLAQLMVIFGLGGLLWAQTFQSKFADFTISPSKKLKIPADGKTGSVSLLSLNQTLRKKMVIGSTFLLIILASVFLLNTKSSFFIKNIPVASTDFSTGKQTDLDKNHKMIKADQHFNSLPPQGNSDQENTLHEGAKNVSIENPSVKEKSSEAIKNTRKIMHKDSVNETSQKVIVVKKIIKRDTIFIER